MTYFVPCFICGSEESNCGHRETDLVVWWRNLQRPTRIEVFTDRSIEPLVTRNPEPESIKPPEALRPFQRSRKPNLAHPWRKRDPDKLARGRMAWPETGLTPEIALGQRGGR